MLVLSRKVGETIRIADNIVIQVLRVNGDHVRIGISAPRDTPVHRDEVYQRIVAGEPLRGIEDDLDRRQNQTR